MEKGHRYNTINNQIYLLISIDLLNLEVKPWLYSNVLWISSALKSKRILLPWSRELNIHLSVLCHRYMYYSVYFVIVGTFVEASYWSGREQDNPLQFDGSLRAGLMAWWFRRYICWDTLELALLFLQRRNYFPVSSGQVDTWSDCISGQWSSSISVGWWNDTFELSLGRYSGVV
jgi:hypothetical protein